ncbi:MAG: hypothetical protein NXI27_30530 [Alphaproteobacteria bacterium]|nr:hypothetical protein [Alphaproteobacteria bacterium]
MSEYENDTLSDGSIVNFRQSPYLQLAQHARGFLGTYLVTLAAYQRGLQVSFLYDAENVRGEGDTGSDMQVGRSFALSDGNKVFRFSSTSGPFTTEFSKRVTYHKHTQKALYKENGVPVPVGMLTSKTTVKADLDKLKADFCATRFVVKPYDGSLARDTYIDQTADEVLALAKNFPADKFMLEEFVSGPEYRFTVVDGHCVGVFERRAPHVVGDGRATVEQLIEQKNKVRENNPFLSPKPIDANKLFDDEEHRNHVLSRIPENEEVVTLSNLQRVGAGGEPWDMSEEMPQAFKDIAIAVCDSIRARNAGIDIIIGSLDDVGSARVLEANIRHHIEGHSFCENKTVWDNSIAEAIIDMYFPETKNVTRHGKAVFDHSKIRRALQAQCFSAMHLPKLDEYWVAWHFFIGVTPAHKAIRKAVLPTIAELGIYMSEVRVDEETSCMTLTAPAPDFEKFMQKTGILRSLALADEIEAAQLQN